MKSAYFRSNSSANIAADTGNGCHPTGAAIPTAEKDLKGNKNLNLNLE